MPKYKVIGEAGITIKDVDYAPGDTVEAAPKDAKWLVDDGYLSPVGKPIAQPGPVEEGDDE